MHRIIPFAKRLVAALLFYFYNSFVSFFPNYCIRHLYLTRVLKIVLGKNSAVHMGCFVTGRNISIGHNTIINRKCCLDGRGQLKIGNNVSISPESYVISMTHDIQSSDFAPVRKATQIDDYVWIGTRALILPGVHVGPGSVVGAGSVVTKDVPPYAIVAGSPARKIGERNQNLNYNLKYRPFFNTDI
jgi:acetyltransferase-like isoleucine patch superfamily enzyme